MPLLGMLYEVDGAFETDITLRDFVRCRGKVELESKALGMSRYCDQSYILADEQAGDVLRRVGYIKTEFVPPRQSNDDGCRIPGLGDYDL